MENVHLANNTNFNGMHVAGRGKVTIGSNFHSGRRCQIITSFHDYDDGEAIPYGTKNIDKEVIIEDNVWLGNDVIVLGGVTIGEGSIIQAGSVICKDIPKYAIAGGHPAVAFKTRDIDHYEKLKAQKAFH
jgi:acetyltransferase-like isoleucine patch superfamily enzyme